MPRIIVTGDKATDKALRQLGPKVANKVATKALRAAGYPLKREVERNAPKGSSHDLETSVQMKPGRRKGYKSISIFISYLTFEGEKVYAARVEFGTGGVRGQHAQRFMTRAYDALKDRTAADLMTRVVAGILAEAKKG